MAPDMSHVRLPPPLTPPTTLVRGDTRLRRFGLRCVESKGTYKKV
jgi:hypothetical protein